jgi:outer membrane protein assembly factor BamB
MYKHDSRHTGLSEYDTSSNPGVEKWKYFVDDALHHTAIIDKNGILYIGDDWNGLHAVFPDGTMKWKINFSWPLTYPMELAIDTDGTIYIGSDTHFFAYYSNGTLKWILDVGEWKNFVGYPVIDSNDIVYTGTDDGYLYAIYPNGTIKWDFFMGGNIRAPAVDNQGNIYFTSRNGRLYCLDQNGSLKWNTEHSDLLITAQLSVTMVLFMLFHV